MVKLSKENPRLERHIQLTSRGRRFVEKLFKNSEGKEGFPSIVQIEVVKEFLRLREEIIGPRIQVERKIEEVLRQMAENRELPLNVFKYLFRESAKSLLSAIENKTKDIGLKEHQKAIKAMLKEVIQFLKRICDRCGGEGKVQLGEGAQREVCPDCKGAGEIEAKGIDIKEFEKY